MRPNMTASAPLSSSSLNLSPLGPRLKGPVQFARPDASIPTGRSEEHTPELQSQSNLVCRLLLEKKKTSRLSSAVNGPTALFATPPRYFTTLVSSLPHRDRCQVFADPLAIQQPDSLVKLLPPCT